jgi:hypothetical protein
MSSNVSLRALQAAAALLFALCVSSANAGTIIKLSLGNDAAADIEYAGGILSTIDDGDGATLGEQNTAVEFLDFLSFIPTIPSADASYSLGGVTAAGAATVLFTSVAQPFTDGFFRLWDDMNTLLLDVDLDDSILFGTLGSPATGAVFSTTFASVVGGSLAPYIDADSISFSLSMTDVASGGGSGMSVTLGPGGYTLNPFEADAVKLIGADQIPEPATALMLAMAGLIAATIVRRRV